MAKFMILYNSTTSASDAMTKSSPEQITASMHRWVAWREDVSSNTMHVDFGLPLQAVNRVTLDGTTDCRSQVSGYTIIEGESKESVIMLLQTHPHLQNPGASIDVFAMLPIPGIDLS